MDDLVQFWRRKVRSNPEDTDARTRLEAELLRTTGQVWYVMIIDYRLTLAEMIEASGWPVDGPWLSQMEVQRTSPGIEMVEMTILQRSVENTTESVCEIELANRGLRPGRVEHLLALGVRRPRVNYTIRASGSAHVLPEIDGKRHRVYPSLFPGPETSPWPIGFNAEGLRSWDRHILGFRLV